MPFQHLRERFIKNAPHSSLKYPGCSFRWEKWEMGTFSLVKAVITKQSTTGERERERHTGTCKGLGCFSPTKGRSAPSRGLEVTSKQRSSLTGSTEYPRHIASTLFNYCKIVGGLGQLFLMFSISNEQGWCFWYL